MLAQKVGAAVPPAAPKVKHQIQSYEQPKRLSTGKRREKSADLIAERRAQIPKLYRGAYDNAIQGRSRKAAMHAFCLECVGYVITEVFSCTDWACPLFPYRPRSASSQNAPESVPTDAESTKSAMGMR